MKTPGGEHEPLFYCDNNNVIIPLEIVWSCTAWLIFPFWTFAWSRSHFTIKS